MHETRSREEALRDYVTRETARLNNLARSGYELQVEPVSALFADQVTVNVIGIDKPDTPVDASVRVSVDITWNEYTKAMIQELDKLGIPFRDLGRTGSVYYNLPTKRLRKWTRYFRELQTEAIQLWATPEWKARGLPAMIALLEKYRERTLYNLDRVSADQTHQILVGDKPPNTGTGYRAPLSTRADMAHHVSRYKGEIAVLVNEYYRDLKEALSVWPEQGSTIYVSGLFKGIIGGTRSDADIVEWSNDHQEHMTQSREVGNDPSSPFHNKQLNPYDWQRQLWESIITPYHFLPMDKEGYKLAMTTPPATMQGQPDDYALVSCDAGACEQAAFYDDNANRLMLRDEGWSFGADQVSMSGIFLLAMENERRIAMLKSGTPFTMSHYVVLFGHPIAWWAQEQGISPQELRILQVGDDMQIIIKRKHIGPLLARFGRFLRTKGMKVTSNGWHIVFILGHYIAYNEDGRVVFWVEPRGLKTVSSAVRVKKTNLPEKVEVGGVYPLAVDPEAKAQAAELWKRYNKYIFMTGTLAELTQLMDSDFIEVKAELARTGGLSEWFDDLTEGHVAVMDTVFKRGPGTVSAAPETPSTEEQVMPATQAATKEPEATPEVKGTIPAEQAPGVAQQESDAKAEPKTQPELVDEQHWQEYVKVLMTKLQPADAQELADVVMRHERWHDQESQHGQ